MEFIFTKKQIMKLKEDINNTGLNVLLPSSSGGTTNNAAMGIINKVKELPDGAVDKLTMNNPKAAKNPQNNKFKIEYEADKPEEVEPNDINKLYNLGSQAGVNSEIDIKEGYVRYSKKELNEILFR